MSIDWGKVAKEYWDRQPHPRAPSLTIGEFATAVKLATMTRFGGHASPEQAALFYPEFKSLGISPTDFEHAIDRLAPVSFAYHGRPPTMQEIVRLKDEPPAKASSYYADLPDRHYPWVTAATMIKNLQAAEPHAQQYLGRPPVKLEAAHLSASGERPADYYARLAQPILPVQGNIQDDTNVQTQVGGNSGGRSSGITWGSASSQRNSPDRRNGIPPRGEGGTASQVGSGAPQTER